MPTLISKVSHFTLILTSLVLLSLVLAPRASADDPPTNAPFEFALWGDLPYTSAGTGASTPKVTNLIEDMNRVKSLAFTVFDGDTKDGSSQCTDTIIGSDVRTRFNSVEAPTVYVPGDNEWTDCHRTNNGGYNNLERLDYIRKTHFATAESFGKRKMTLEHQGTLGGPFSENTRWVYNGIVFVGINMPGSNNNKVGPDECIVSSSKRDQAQCTADNVEYMMRDAMNLQWLKRSFALAKDFKSPGIMIIVQADPGFDLPETTTNERNAAGSDGFNNFMQALTQETQAFSGQVVFVHGDTHYFKVDQPLLEPTKLLTNFTRVETYGSGNAHWVKAIVDPASKRVFEFEPMIVPGN